MAKNKEVFQKLKSAKETYEGCAKKVKEGDHAPETMQAMADAMEQLNVAVQAFIDEEKGGGNEGSEEEAELGDNEVPCPVCKGHGSVPKTEPGVEGDSEVTEAGVKKTTEALAIINPAIAKHFTECHAVAKGVKAVDAHRKLAESVRGEYIAAGMITKESISIDELAGLANAAAMNARIMAKSQVAMRESFVAPGGIPAGGFGVSYGPGVGGAKISPLTEAQRKAKAESFKKNNGGN